MKNKNLLYEVADYLSQHHRGKENGIPRTVLAKKLDIDEIKLKAIRRAINESMEIEMLVSTSGSCYVCDNEAECERAISNTFKMGVALIKKGRTMAKKMGLNGQVKIPLGDDYKEIVEVFEK